MSRIKVVRVTEKEYPDFAALIEWRRTGREQVDLTRYDDDEMKRFFRQFGVLSSNTFFFFAARMDNRYVGYINAVLIPKPDPRLGILYVDELWVPECFRQKGIGSVLMNEVFLMAKELRLWRVRLYVGTCNETARSFYRKCGFIEKDDSKFCEIDVTALGS